MLQLPLCDKLDRSVMGLLSTPEIQTAFAVGIQRYINAKAWRSISPVEKRKRTWHQIAVLIGVQAESTIHRWRRARDGSLANVIKTVLCLCDDHKSLELADFALAEMKKTEAAELYDAGFAHALQVCVRKRAVGNDTDLEDPMMVITHLRPLFRKPKWLVKRSGKNRRTVLEEIHRDEELSMQVDELDRLEGKWGPVWITVRAAFCSSNIWESASE